MRVNDRKAEQLGMPLGTACARLRKRVLFKLVQEVGLDTCFKCDRLIETERDLSIEHKLPWFNRDVELFWDLDNIAFSHLRCNRPHKSGPRNRPRIREDGMVWCKGHEEYLPPDEFSYYSGKGRTNFGPRSHCKACRAELRRANKPS